MPLLKGSVSVAPFQILEMTTAEPDFEAARFEPIEEGSEVRMSSGFVPMAQAIDDGTTGPDLYRFGTKRWVARYRMDELKADPGALKDRIAELIREEFEAGADAVSKKRRQELAEQAEAELVIGTVPTRKYVELVIAGDKLYIASTSKAYLGQVLSALRRIGVNVAQRAPWEQEKLEELTLEAIESLDVGESAWASRFLSHLVEQSTPALGVELEDGAIKLATTDSAKVTVRGVVKAHLVQHLEAGSELLSAKLAAGDLWFNLDLRWWVRGLKLPACKSDHWTDALEQRLEKIEDLFDLLERRFAELRPAIEAGCVPENRATRQAAIPAAALTVSQRTEDIGDGSIEVDSPGEGERPPPEVLKLAAEDRSAMGTPA